MSRVTGTTAGSRVTTVLSALLIGCLLTPACKAEQVRGSAPQKPQAVSLQPAIDTVAPRQVTAAAGSRPAPASPGHPNEPPGYVAFAENDGSEINLRGAGEGRRGNWRARSERQADRRMVVVQDPSAPASPPGVIRTRFPAGMVAGRGPVSWVGWDREGPVEKSAIYLSIWLRVAGPDYENQKVGTKMGFLGYGQDPEVGANNQGYFLLEGTGQRQAVQREFRMRFYQQGFVQRVLTQNTDRRALLRAGQWHHLEVVATVNETGGRNGTFKMWIDGRMVMNYSNMVFRTAARPFQFTSWKWNPTWGGREGTRTRDDYIEFDHIYLSGIP